MQNTIITSHHSIELRNIEISVQHDTYYSIYDIENINHILQDEHLNYDKFFQNFFPYLIRRDQTHVVTLKKLASIISEATILSKIEIELIQYAQEHDVHDKLKFIKKFYNSDVYKNYFHNDCIVSKTREVIQYKLGGTLKGLTTNLMYGLNKIQLHDDFNEIYERVKNNIDVLKERIGDIPNNKDLVVKLHSLKNNKTSIKFFILSILASNPKELGLLLAVLQQNKSLNRDIVLKVEKSTCKTQCKSISVTFAGITGLALIGLGLSATVGLESKVGVIWSAAINGGLLYTAYAYMDDLKAYFTQKALNCHKAKVASEELEIQKIISENYNKDKELIHNDEANSRYTEDLMKTCVFHEEGRSFKMMQFLQQQLKENHIQHI